MKKNYLLTISVLSLLITWHTLNSQNKVSNYIQFSVGYNPSYSYASSSHTYSGAYPPINSGRIKSARAAIKSVIPADMHPF